MTKVIVRRANALWQDRVRKYSILLDGKEVAEVSNGSEVAFDVEAGQHEVQMKIDWCTSRKLEIDVSTAEPLTLECGPNASPFTALLYISLWKNDYMWLR